jgi:hypothetical protein
MDRERRIRALASAIAPFLALLLLAGCNPETLPEGQEQVASFCGPFATVAEAFPLDVPPDTSNPGENLRARDQLEQLGFELAALNDAIRIADDSQMKQAFSRYSSRVGDALRAAEGNTSGLDTPSEWLQHQERLNDREANARATLVETLSGLGVDLRAECGVR